MYKNAESTRFSEKNQARVDLSETASQSSSSSSSSSSVESEEEIDHVDVTLGFAEEVADFHVFDPCRFPSKLGGLPVWLYGKNNPPCILRCKVCDAVLSFLVQLYAPIDYLEHCFHRTVYVFICRSQNCGGGQGTARVLRTQLHRGNPLYQFSAIGTTHEDNPRLDGSALSHPTRCLCKLSDSENTSTTVGCTLCGCKATARCGKCSLLWYCSRDCQKIDWRLGHRDQCGKLSEHESSENLSLDMRKKRQRWRFRQYEIVHEQCPSPGDSGDIELRASEDNADERNGSSLTGPSERSCIPKGSLQDVSEDELPESLFRHGSSNNVSRPRTKDRAFQRFCDSMASAPSQIVRYWRGGRPIWPCKVDPSSLQFQTTRQCSRCGGALHFEFQLLPQLLHYLGVDSEPHLKPDASSYGGLDWGTIAIYTCEQSCTVGGDEHGSQFSYQEETAIVCRLDAGI